MKKRFSTTCIAIAKNRKGKLMMAGDRLVSVDWGHSEYLDFPKIKKEGEILLGFCGSLALAELITRIDIPIIEYNDAYSYLQYSLKPAIIKTLKQAGYYDEHKLLRIPTYLECSLLVGLFGKAFVIDIMNPELDCPDVSMNSEITITSLSLPNAIGCGTMSALVSLKKDLKQFGYNTKQHIEEAIELACEISPGCGLPAGQKPDVIVED